MRDISAIEYCQSQIGAARSATFVVLVNVRDAVTDEVRMTQADIAVRIGRSVCTVARHLALLESLGMIIRRPQYDPVTYRRGADLIIVVPVDDESRAIARAEMIERRIADRARRWSVIERKREREKNGRFAPTSHWCGDNLKEAGAKSLNSSWNKQELISPSRLLARVEAHKAAMKALEEA